MSHSSKSVKDFLDAMFRKIDLKKVIKEVALDGYDTVEDYVKYGDAITPIQRSDGTSRVLVRRPST